MNGAEAVVRTGFVEGETERLTLLEVAAVETADGRPVERWGRPPSGGPAPAGSLVLFAGTAQKVL